jgi:phosphotriesterase-related protein
VSIVRTVIGDIEPVNLGITYAHEHLVIDGGKPVELFPDFLLADVDRAVRELEPATALGLRACVDAMPGGAGRNVEKLAEISRRSNVHVIAPTGLHLAMYYPDDHPAERMSVEELADWFASEVEHGIDGSEHRAGVIKVAGSADGLTSREQRAYEAAAIAHARTGVPIIAHCTNGAAAPVQARFLADHGVDLGHVVLSHTDKVVDRSYHREILATGVSQEFDQAFRWPDESPNGTLTLLEWLFEDGLGGQLMLGNDAARQSYWTQYGGSPGMTFLLGPFAARMEERGLGADAQRRLFVDNPAAAFAFASPH